MHRWEVSIAGAEDAVSQYPYWFPSGEPAFCFFDGEECLITGSAFDGVSTEYEAHSLAKGLLEEMHSILCVLNQAPEA
ncbi:MAG: hypothetical protein ACK56F_07820, partial [bacterium]